MIPYGRQNISREDVEAVVEVLRSDFLTQGPTVPAFERAVAEKVGARFGIAVNSATSALHVGCLALGLGPGDSLWTSANTFVASANCARYCGASVDFVDIDARTANMSSQVLADKLHHARRTGARLPKVVVPVHFGGQPTEQEAIWELSREYGFRVLEDASHSIGASRHDEPVGSCRWSDITVVSFHPVKVMTTGEGGMALCNDDRLAAMMQLLRTHGVTRDPQFMESVPAGPWYYEQIELGFNYRMTDIQAALGLSQLLRLPDFVATRNRLARRYGALLAGLPVKPLEVAAGNRSAFHLYVIRLPTPDSARRRTIVEGLRDAGIGVNLHYMPVYLQPYYRRMGFAPGLCPEAEAYAEAAMTIPLFVGLTDDQQDVVVSALRTQLTSVP